MVHAFGTPKRHPESGVFLFRKRVAERKKTVGKGEIKFLPQTRDVVVARSLGRLMHLRAEIGKGSRHFVSENCDS